MLENKDKVLEKEEIINAVWKEAKTTMGVTDQALDQLIFRLRKKTEQDPNSPTHILTVKGRGFKFV
jgi:two-component system response regulator MtrA